MSGPCLTTSCLVLISVLFALLSASSSFLFTLSHILTLLEELCLALGDEFRPQLPALIGRFMEVFQSDRTEHREATTRVLHALRVVASARAKGSLEDYLHIVLPALVRLCESPDELLHMRVATVHTIGAIAATHDIAEHASRIIHPFSRILAATNANSVSALQGGGATSAGMAAGAGGGDAGLSPATLYNECLSVLCRLILQLGFGFIVFEPIIRGSLSRVGTGTTSKIESMQHLRYQRIVDRLLAKVQQVRDQLSRTEARAAAASNGGALGAAGLVAATGTGGSGGGGALSGGYGGSGGGMSGGGGGPSQPHQNLLISPDLESYHDFKLICFTQGIELNDLDDFPSEEKHDR